MTKRDSGKAGKQAAADTLRRQWELLRLIPRSPRKVTATEITEKLSGLGFSVSSRTVQRDLQTLSASFPILNDERSKPFGWSWKRDVPAISLPGLTVSEALAFSLMKQFMTPLLPASIVGALSNHFALAEKTLREAPGVVRNWPSKVRIVHPTQVLQTPAIAPKVYQDITEALLHGRQLRATYGRDAEKTKDLVLHPLALVQRGQVTYLVARTFSYPDPRLYVAHRFRATKVLDDANVDDFDIDTYIASGALGFGKGNLIELEVRLHRSAAVHIRESPLSVDQTLVEENGETVRLAATVADTPQLRWWLMGFGATAEVLGPAPLRREFLTIGADLARIYAP